MTRVRRHPGRERRSATGRAWRRAVGALAVAMVAAGCAHEPDDTVQTPAVPGPTPSDSALRYVGSDPPAPPSPPKPSLLAEPAPRPTEPVTFEAGCVNESCHAVYAVANHIHGPLAAGDCASCHAEDTGTHAFPMKRPGNRTCTFCHFTGSGRVHRHEALDDEQGCLSCHRAHVSDTKFLLTAGSVQAVCVSCHPGDEGRFAHGPFSAGECGACHDPHESDHEHLLRGGGGADHCFTCHQETSQAVTNAPFVHEPVRTGCTECHSAHASDYELHLRQPIERLCFTCHKDLERTVAGATSPHAAVFTARQCANCHDAHAAGRPKLLRNRQTELCLECHREAIRTDDGHVIPDMTASVTGRRYLHGPVESGDCSACHSVHGASHARLLKETFPTAFYAGFDLQSYTLCFSCHPQELVLAERTDSLTDFRDGERNLHFLHVNREQKGRSCKTCHSIHGSDLPRHVASEVPFESSDWLMPIGFRKTDTGGSCAPGCHAAMTYDRRDDPAPIAPPPQGGGP